MNRRVAWLLVGIGTFGHALDALGQTRTGREVYQIACAACHGSDGSGAPAVESGYPLVPPDFRDCNFSTREPTADWVGVGHHGGPNRAFSPLMPAFGGALSRQEIELAVSHARSFCTEAAWPRGELNFPRALVTTKAFPEDEAVLTVIAADGVVIEGVSCALCHQITSGGLGSKASFTGGFVIETAPPAQGRQMFGPYEVEPGPRSVMRSATGLQPAASTHIQRSEVCATCHTLYTHALNASGEATSEFPEQMPYQEWLHSGFRDSQSCQSCHMPVVTGPMPIASVVGQPQAVSRHDFRGANFLMLGILNRFRAELGVGARPAELDAAVMRTKAFLQSSSASIAVEGARMVGGRLNADVIVRNLAGHKLPTAYPSRRSWLHVTVRDGEGRLVFSSGQVEPTHAIAGNDNDRDAARFEPHHREIRSGDDVQIYEAIMGTATGQVTTGLLSAVSYLKDNRLPPRGFDKRTAHADVAVHGDAVADPDFGAGEDRVRYSVDTAGARGPFTIEAQLWYQSIGYRWARNLDGYKAAEPRRFVSYYDQVAPESALLLTRATRTVD